ncbi:helix-turn-helix domain-containing protein [Saccharicrinis sp. FJH54]|uniref:helix-turn-helix domain-containing protein n=1 Tax=Saccharicrinis sp. FJH54 TaxID=3344665 RepID=UPI0035D51D7F
MYQLDDKEIREIIGKKIRNLRKENCNNYETFCKIHNFNKVTIFRLESGDNYRISTLIQVLDALNLTLGEFFSDWDKEIESIKT